ncbi:guanosine-diphosphatase [Malassezia vespertilionis]|uniref:guanosine-diphosphatase n=1 Tax=Malassezia vespertilionis TaxID=2020962 RepID=A0A2N1JDL4_9BASI|nr:guanosine-diphosphatase [Malassezia vespertilionis]PKI84650.1 Gda1p [Malassezia vespertilionis]WFD06523.1 guanosine-diphosphatase [Malassezia vespertilionis]
MALSVVAWLQRAVSRNKSTALLAVALIFLLIIVPLQLHQNVRTMIHDKAIELSNEMARPVAALSGHWGNNIDIDALARKPPEMHVDRSRTTRCTVAAPVYDAKGKQRPLVQYALMIDAGSTGSRIHVYKFNYCNDSPELELEHFDHLEPGLSFYKMDSRDAAASLRPLLDRAMQIIPQKLQACSPVTVKATAGLRLLPGTQSTEIISAVRRLLEKDYPFPIADGNHAPGTRGSGVEIMDGREEGVFAWITVNYLLNLIGSKGKGTKYPSRTAAVLDLGGGSTQIVFEPRMSEPMQQLHPGEHVYELHDFENKTFTLYQNSYLGFGLKEARHAVNSLTAFAHLRAHPSAVHVRDKPEHVPAPWTALSPFNTRIPSPCYTHGQKKQTLVSFPTFSSPANVTFEGTTRGFEACARIVEVVMDKDAECAQAPCSFAGVYQPSLSEAFKGSPIIALSYFYDRIAPLGLGPTFTLGHLKNLAKRVCSTPPLWSTYKSPAFSEGALAEMHARPELCLDLTYMYTLFKLGYELDDSRSITLAKKVGDFELGWALGAQLAVLQQGVLCK